MEDDRVLCYGFDPDSNRAEEALLEALEALGKSENRRLRDRAFKVWGGDYGPHYWIAVPANLPAGVKTLLFDRLGKAEGYATFDHGRAGRMSLLPIYRYDRGAVAESGDDEEASP